MEKYIKKSIVLSRVKKKNLNELKVNIKLHKITRVLLIIYIKIEIPDANKTYNFSCKIHTLIYIFNKIKKKLFC